LSNPNLVGVLDTALRKAGTVAFDLVQAARLIGMYEQLPSVNEREWQKQWQGLNQNAKASINAWIDHTGMERNYWADLDIPFQSFVVDLVNEQELALAIWHEQLRKSAQNALEWVVNSVGNDGRSMKAVVRGQNYLHYRLNEVFPTVQQKTSENL
jgi:post-segregation antitoxin (ccd killing protein)